MNHAKIHVDTNAQTAAPQRETELSYHQIAVEKPHTESTVTARLSAC